MKGPALQQLRERLQPIDEDARDGRFRMVFGAGEFAVARWRGHEWAFGSEHPLPYEPELYLP